MYKPLYQLSLCMQILIIKTSSLGDIIHTFPVVSAIKVKYPNAQIDWLVEAPFAELLKAHPDVNHVMTIHTRHWRKQIFHPGTWKQICHSYRKLREKKYDAVLDLQGNMKSACFTAFAKSGCKVGYGLKTVYEWPNCLVTNKRYNPPPGLNVREENLFVAQDVCAKIQQYSVTLNIQEAEKQALELILNHPLLLNRKKILVCPGSFWKNKQLPQENLVQYLRSISNAQTSFIFAWGTDAEKKICQSLQQNFETQSLLLDKLSLPLLQNLMACMDLVIAMDSLPLHLAATTSTATFSVFGASSAAKYKPVGRQHVAIQGLCPYGRQFERRCPILRTCPTGACMHIDCNRVL